LEEYEITSEDIKTPVKIMLKDYSQEYCLILPEVDVATTALLDDIKERLITQTDVGSNKALDPKLMDILKKDFMDNAKTLLESELPGLDPAVRDHFILSLVHELLGLDEIEFFLDDEGLEEIVINSASEPVRVYHKRYGWLRTNILPESEAKIQNYASMIGRRVGREITTLNPLLDAHLLSKDRANAILAPISSKGNTITIRKFARDPWTATDFINNKTVSSEVLALVWLMIQYEMNIVISGGTGSGKTSTLNICMPFIPPNHRIISIEDTRELQLPEFLYWCPLTTREPNPEGKGEVSMLQLLINSLRMRPDRIVMGEVRKQREAEVLFEAMHTGHSVYCTIHADTCEQTITRLTNPPIDIPHSMLDAVHLNVVMFRDRRRNIRRFFEVGEFIPDKRHLEEGKMFFKPNVIYKWDPRSDQIKSSMMPMRLFEELERHTGLNRQEIGDELDVKKKILEWMVEHKIRRIEDVGKVMNRYYMDKDSLTTLVEKNGDPKEILE
jgi:flagellar protein FlaI